MKIITKVNSNFEFAWWENKVIARNTQKVWIDPKNTILVLTNVENTQIIRDCEILYKVNNPILKGKVSRILFDNNNVKNESVDKRKEATDNIRKCVCKNI